MVTPVDLEERFMQPTLSVIICTFNNCDLLKDCLNSLKEQNITLTGGIELLVVDNNSTDDTKKVVEKFMQDNCLINLRYIFEPSPGLTHARLAGVKKSTCDWIAFIDDDVRVQNNWIHSALLFVQNHPEAGVVSGKIQPQYVKPPSTAALQCESALCKVDYGMHDLNFKPEGPAIRLVGAAIIFQKRALVETGWLEKHYLTGRTGQSLSSGEDTEMIMRIKNRGWEIWYTPSLYATHLIPPRRMTVNYLCRLHRGLARTSVQLQAIGMEGKVSLILQLRTFWAAVAFTARRIGAWIFHDLVLNQSVGDKRLIQIYEGIGRIESCIAFIFKPIKFEK